MPIPNAPPPRHNDNDAELAVPPKTPIPNLLVCAYNMYAAKMRAALKEAGEHGTGIEKIVGTLWKAMGPDEKSVHINRAKLQQEKLLIAEGGVPQFQAALPQPQPQPQPSPSSGGGGCHQGGACTGAPGPSVRRCRLTSG